MIGHTGPRVLANFKEPSLDAQALQSSDSGEDSLLQRLRTKLGPRSTVEMPSSSAFSQLLTSETATALRPGTYRWGAWLLDLKDDGHGGGGTVVVRPNQTGPSTPATSSSNAGNMPAAARASPFSLELQQSGGLAWCGPVSVVDRNDAELSSVGRCPRQRVELVQQLASLWPELSPAPPNAANRLAHSSAKPLARLQRPGMNLLACTSWMDPLSSPIMWHCHDCTICLAPGIQQSCQAENTLQSDLSKLADRAAWAATGPTPQTIDAFKLRSQAARRQAEYRRLGNVETIAARTREAANERQILEAADAFFAAASPRAYMAADTGAVASERSIEDFLALGAKRADFRRAERKFVDADTGEVEATEQ